MSVVGIAGEFSQPRICEMMMSLALVPRNDEEDAEDALAAYALFDQDNSGHITVEEIEDVLKGPLRCVPYCGRSCQG